MKKRSFLIASAVLVLSIFFIRILISEPGPSEINLAPDGKEYERGGPPSLIVNNSSKLNAVLTPEQFFAAKEVLSGYIFERLGPDVGNVSIQKTELRQNGSVNLNIVAGNTSFEAEIDRTESNIVFRVPSANYEVRKPASSKIIKEQGIN